MAEEDDTLTVMNFHFPGYIRINALVEITRIANGYIIDYKKNISKYDLEFKFIHQAASQPFHFRCENDEALLATMIRIYSVACEIWNEPAHKIINEVQKVFDVFIKLDEKYKTIIDFYEPIWKRYYGQAKYHHNNT